MDDIILFSDLCLELELYPEALMSKVKRAHTLFNKGLIDYDVLVLVMKDKLFIEKHNRIQVTKYIFKTDKDKFIEAISLVDNHKGKSTGDYIVEYWNTDSTYCYKIGGVCSKCIIAKGYPALKQECKMKKHVINLVRLHGTPKMV